MKLEFSDAPLTDLATDALIVGRFLDGTLSDTLQEKVGSLTAELFTDTKGKASDEVAVVYPQGAIAAKRLLIVGLGAADKLTLEGVRRAFAKGIAKAQKVGAKNVATSLNQLSGGKFSAGDAARAVVESAELTLYNYSLKRKPAANGDDEPENGIDSLTLIGAEERTQAAAKLGAAIASGVVQARDLVNAPPNIANAPHLAQTARDIADSNPHIKATIYSLQDAIEMGMGAFAGVAQGSATPAHFIVLEYRTEELKDQRPFGLVGKGLIFDTGGISLKPGEGMWKMKNDMGGGAAVLGTFRALANLPEPLPIPVVGIVPTTDNAIDSNSFTPADVLTALNGKTIEIQNTDAEGRLILADALTYVDRFKPRAVIDLATLTGAVVVALGQNLTGMYATEDELATRIQNASAYTHEEVWRMPLYDEYERLIDSSIADVKNVGSGRAGGSITAALFLRRFIGNYPWAHLDIAGTAWGEDRSVKVPYNQKGASGVGVRLLMEVLLGYTE